MTKAEFCSRLADALELDPQEVEIKTDLTALEEYDSLSVLAIIALIDEEFSVALTGDQLGQITTVASLIDLVGDDRFED